MNARNLGSTIAWALGGLAVLALLAYGARRAIEGGWFTPGGLGTDAPGTLDWGTTQTVGDTDGTTGSTDGTTSNTSTSQDSADFSPERYYWRPNFGLDASRGGFAPFGGVGGQSFDGSLAFVEPSVRGPQKAFDASLGALLATHLPADAFTSSREIAARLPSSDPFRQLADAGGFRESVRTVRAPNEVANAPRRALDVQFRDPSNRVFEHPFDSSFQPVVRQFRDPSTGRLHDQPFVSTFVPVDTPVQRSMQSAVVDVPRGQTRGIAVDAARAVDAAAATTTPGPVPSTARHPDPSARPSGRRHQVAALGSRRARSRGQRPARFRFDERLGRSVRVD